EVKLRLLRLRLEKALQTKTPADFRVVREEIENLEPSLRDQGEGPDLLRALIRQAQSRFERARDLAGEDPSKHAEEIKRLVTDARVIWPRLPGLENFLRQQERKYPILFVGVRELPQYFSPATAATDTERQAVELLFESLVRPEYTVLQSGQKEQVSCRYGAGL